MPTNPTAIIRTTPADFVVEEIPAYPASGEGDHLFVTFRKTGLDTPRAVRALAELLGADAREAGWAGMKDRHAITTQTASFACRDGDAEAKLAQPPEGIEVLAVERHGHKLKTGHLRGNRFTITLRQLAAEAVQPLAEQLDRIGLEGVPNAFGPQRFGRDGTNPERALSWLSGEQKPPRSKKHRRLLFSALQSKMFNQLLQVRVADGSWRSPLEGDLAQKHDSGGVFEVGPEDLADAQLRASRRELSPTGPMFGAKMRWPSGAPEALERQVLEQALADPTLLDRHKALGRGARRTLRLVVSEMHCEAGPDYLVARFMLPKGGYATTVLSEVCDLADHTRRPKAEPNSSQNDPVVAG